METVPEPTNQGTPLHGDPHPFPCFGNIGPPYIATLSLPRFTIGLLVWLFSTLVMKNAPGALNAIRPPQEHQPPVDPFPSLPVGYSSLFSSMPGEICDASNQEAKKETKRKNKERKNKRRGNQPTIVNHVGSVDNVDKPKNIGQKPKFPCSLCKGDHLLNHCPGIHKVLEVWYQGSQQPVSPTFAGHSSDGPSTNDKFKFPCKLCNANHHTYHFPRIEEASQLLEDNVVSQQQPSIASQESYPTQPMVDEVVNRIRSSIDPTLPSKSDLNTIDIFFVS
jgi:hypothetical protein